MADKTNVELLEEILRDLHNATPDILGCALVSIDGFIISSYLEPGIDEESLAGLTTAVIGVGERVATELLKDRLEQTYIKAGNGYVVINSVTEETLLVILTSSSIKLGLAFLEIKKAIRQVGGILTNTD